jgi:hypothetical protein
MGSGARDGSLASQNPDFFAAGGSYIGRFFFDYLYWLLITVILTAIVTGIVIDAFGGMRSLAG